MIVNPTDALLPLASAAEIGGGLFAGFGILIVILALATLALWIWAFIDILGRNMDGTKKLLWIVVILVAPLIGAILYLLIGRKV